MLYDAAPQEFAGSIPQRIDYRAPRGTHVGPLPDDKSPHAAGGLRNSPVALYANATVETRSFCVWPCP